MEKFEFIKKIIKKRTEEMFSPSCDYNDCRYRGCHCCRECKRNRKFKDYYIQSNKK